MRRVVRLSVTSVKSTALQHPEEVTLERSGVAGRIRVGNGVEPLSHERFSTAEEEAR